MSNQQLSELNKSLTEAHGAIEEQAEFINRIQQAAMKLGTVVAIPAKKDQDGFMRVLITTSEGLLAVMQTKPPMSLGQAVAINTKTGQIVSASEAPTVGVIVVFVSEISEHLAEISQDGITRAVYNTLVGCVKDDRVMLDTTGQALIRNMGKVEEQVFFNAPESVEWERIGGLAAAKAELHEALVLPYTHSSTYGHYNKKLPKGILMWGPPGCGKTMLAKAAATELAKRCDSNAPSGFIYIKGPELLSKYVGEAEARIRQIFNQAREHKAVYGVPAVIFIDEADAILSKRGTGISSDMEKTIVPAFLAEMDGMEDSGAIVLLATNRPDQLDPAITRDGRIDRKIRIGRPDQAAAADIFEKELTNTPVAGCNKAELAKAAANSLFSAQRGLYAVGTDSGQYVFTLAHLTNGAMVAGIVDQAVSFAIARDIKDGKITGVNSEDMLRAINRAQEQQSGLNHQDDLEQFAKDRGEELANVIPVI